MFGDEGWFHCSGHLPSVTDIDELVHEALALWFVMCVVCCECKYAYSVTPIQYTDSDAGFCTPVRLRDNACYC